MMERVPYTDNVEREAILNSKSGKILIEDVITLNGNYLIFSNRRVISQDELEGRIAVVEREVVDLKTRIKSPVGSD